MWACNLVSEVSEKYTKKAFHARLMKRILEYKEEEIIRGWIKLHIEQLHDWFSSPYNDELHIS